MLAVIGATEMKYLLVLSMLFVVSDASAGMNETWQKTKEVTNDAITVSKEAGGKALEASKQAYSKLSDASSSQQTPEERFKEIWGDLIEELDTGLDILIKTKDAPDSAIFKKDKLSLRTDFNKILDKIITLLSDPNIQDSRNKIDVYRNHIKETKREIREYREKKVVAPQGHMVKTTKDGYDKKIQIARQDIEQLKNQIEETHLQLVESFKAIGLNLDIDQVAVILSRVDSENIIQMSAVFDVLKQITEQLIKLTKSSGEDIETAKRYYGMQVILIETVIYMQNKYIEQLNNEFLPKLKGIVSETSVLHRNTKRSISKASHPNQKKVYTKNLEAQKLTIKVARLYMDNFKSQRGKVEKAKSKALGDLELARNTYETVTVSAELMNLLNSNQESFEVIMNLQVPEIVPFENLEMKEEFQRLSLRMQEME